MVLTDDQEETDRYWNAIVGNGGPQFFGDGRIVYAPVEDLLFGFALVLFAVSTWVRLGRSRAATPARPPGRERTPEPG